MERGEHSKPPAKRVKVALLESTGGSGGVDQLAWDLPAEGDGEDTIGTKGIIRKKEFLRVLASALYWNGCTKSAESLHMEAKIPMWLSPPLIEFFNHLGQEKWDDCVAALQKIGFSKDVVISATRVIWEHKFLELMRDQKHLEATELLFKLAFLDPNNKRLPEVANAIVVPRPVDSMFVLWEKLEKALPAGVIIHGRRLEHLVEQALEHQRDSCVFHNTVDRQISLYRDHQCGTNKIPSRTLKLHS